MPSGLKRLHDRSESKGVRFAGDAMRLDDGRSSSSNSQESDSEKRPSKEMSMRAIEHVAGKVISEVSIIGIEIRAELHDITERVAHMHRRSRLLRDEWTTS